MPNRILKLILAPRPLTIDQLLEWTWYVPQAKEKDYILKVANALYERP